MSCKFWIPNHCHTSNFLFPTLPDAERWEIFYAMLILFLLMLDDYKDRFSLNIETKFTNRNNENHDKCKLKNFHQQQKINK